MNIPFVKACALGNDFVIVIDGIPFADELTCSLPSWRAPLGTWPSMYFPGLQQSCAPRNDEKNLSQSICKRYISDDQKELATLSRKLADRRWGVGCDQVIYVRPTTDSHVYNIRFFNADGSEAEACGNGSRCVAKLLIQQHNLKKITLQTLGGILDCNLLDDGTVRIILPLPVCVKTIDLNHSAALFLSTVFVDIGNPHLVCFIDDVTVAQKWGPILETYLPEIDSAMPPRVNVGFVKLLNRNSVLLSVWERGAGFTEACGTGACAAAVACHAQSLIDQIVHVNQKGGHLIIQVNEHNLSLQGEARLIYSGSIDLEV